MVKQFLNIFMSYHFLIFERKIYYSKNNSPQKNDVFSSLIIMMTYCSLFFSILVVKTSILVYYPINYDLFKYSKLIKFCAVRRP